jgi:hypothetical protein
LRPLPSIEPASTLKIALVADELTRACLTPECRLVDVPPLTTTWGFHRFLSAARPDMLLVESTWHGPAQSWRYRVASYPRHAWLRSNRRLRLLVRVARDMGIPTVFWNKEDGVHFDRFIASARLFDMSSRSMPIASTAIARSWGRRPRSMSCPFRSSPPITGSPALPSATIRPPSWAATAPMSTRPAVRGRTWPFPPRSTAGWA